MFIPLSAPGFGIYVHGFFDFEKMMEGNKDGRKANQCPDRRQRN